MNTFFKLTLVLFLSIVVNQAAAADSTWCNSDKMCQDLNGPGWGCCECDNGDCKCGSRCGSSVDFVKQHTCCNNPNLCEDYQLWRNCHADDNMAKKGKKAEKAKQSKKVR